MSDDWRYPYEDNNEDIEAIDDALRAESTAKRRYEFFVQLKQIRDLPEAVGHEH